MNLKNFRNLLLRNAKSANRMSLSNDISDSHVYLRYNTKGVFIGRIGFDTIEELEEDIKAIQEDHGELPDRIEVTLYSGSDKDGFMMNCFHIRTEWV